MLNSIIFSILQKIYPDDMFCNNTRFKSFMLKIVVNPIQLINDAQNFLTKVVVQENFITNIYIYIDKPFSHFYSISIKFSAFLLSYKFKYKNIFVGKQFKQKLIYLVQ